MMYQVKSISLKMFLLARKSQQKRFPSPKSSKSQKIMMRRIGTKTDHSWRREHQRKSRYQKKFQCMMAKSMIQRRMTPEARPQSSPPM